MGKKHFRKRNRLKEFDYSLPGYYFITICTKNMNPIFGNIVIEKMVLNPLGKVVEKYWLEIPKHFPYVELDVFTIMPNHIHGIIIIDSELNKNFQYSSAINKNFRLLQKEYYSTLSSIIKGFKIGVTKWRKQQHFEKSIWQTSFYDRIIRNDKELYNIKKYILENPMKWDIEKNIIDNLDGDVFL